MAKKHERKAFFIEEWDPLLRQYVHVCTLSNREKILNELKARYRDLKYVIEGRNPDQWKELGSYQSFCRRWSSSQFILLSGETTVRNDRVKVKVSFETYFNPKANGNQTNQAS